MIELKVLGCETCMEVFCRLCERSGPAPNTTRLADELDMPLYTVSKNLKKLVNIKLVRAREVGRVKLWYVTERGEKIYNLVKEIR